MWSGYTAGPTLAGVVLTSSNHNWHVVSLYSGGMQLLGVILFLYGLSLTLRSRKQIRVLRKKNSISQLVSGANADFSSFFDRLLPKSSSNPIDITASHIYWSLKINNAVIIAVNHRSHAVTLNIAFCI